MVDCKTGTDWEQGMMESGDLKNRSQQIPIEPVDEQQRDPCWMFLGTERRSTGWTHCMHKVTCSFALNMDSASLPNVDRQGAFPWDFRLAVQARTRHALELNRGVG